MGRKIPGKKHRGVKDPLEQQNTRNERVKNKINAPPTNIDDQPIPDSLQKIIEWQQLDREGKTKRKRRKRKTQLIDSRNFEEVESHESGIKFLGKSTPAFIQRPGETDKKFLQRIDEVCEEVVKESKICRGNSQSENDDLNEKKSKGDIDEIIMRAGGNKRSKPNVGSSSTKKDKIKSMLHAKKQAKLDKVQEKLLERNRFVDHVKFGEVVHAPPNLSLPTRNKPTVKVDKPGQRELLLKTLLSKTDPKKQTKKHFVSNAEKDLREENRLKAVEEYRKIKRKQRSNARSTRLMVKE